MKKQLIILAHHVYTGHASPAKAFEFLKEYKAGLPGDDDDYTFKHLLFSVKEEENARIDCVYPNTK